MKNVKRLITAGLVAASAALSGLSASGDGGARVVVDSHTGAVVMNEDVRIGRVAVMAGGLTVRTTETPQVSQPGPFARSGRTVVVPRTRVQVDEGGGGGGKPGRLVMIEENASLGELVAHLNRLHLSPGELIQVLQAIKAAGGLQAEIVVK